MTFQEKSKNGTHPKVLSFFVVVLAFIMTALVMLAPQVTANNDLVNTDIAVEYLNTHNATLLAQDATISYNGTQHTIQNRDAIEQLNSALYRSGGVILGVETEVTQVTALSETVIMIEYIYSGTAFYGDVYPLETMVDYETISVLLVSIYEIVDGMIHSEIIFDAATPLPFAITLDSGI